MNDVETYGDHDHDVHGLAALYAVDALEPAERVRFEEHLRDCASCRQEVAGYAEVGAHLAAGVAQDPPPSLRDDVLAAIRTTSPLPAQTATGPAAAGSAATASAATAPAASRADAAERPDAVVVSLDARRRRSRRWLGAAAAAVLVPGVALGGWSAGVQSEQREQQRLVAQQQEEQAQEQRLLAAPDVVTRRIELDGRTATLVVSRQQGEALFVSSGLPDPGQDRAYQLWLMEDGVPVPDVHFSGGEVRAWLAGDVTEAAAVAMTVEPAGGSETPTLPVVASTEL